MSQLDQMAVTIEEMQIPTPLQVSQLRGWLARSQNCISADGSVRMRAWDTALRIAQASEQLQLALQHWKELADERRREEREEAQATTR